MKKLQRFTRLLLLTLFAITGTVTAQSTTGCCTLADSLARVVRLEAAHLTRDAILAQGGPRADSIELPQDLIDTYYAAICAVRNEHSVITDSLFLTLGYAYHPYSSVDEVIVSVDKNAPWYLKLRDSISPTGYAPLDSLISTFELAITYVYEGNDSENTHLVFFTSGRYLNTEALGRAFATLEGVEFARASGGIGDGDRLEGMVFPKYTSLLFSIGSGDCPSGCTNRSFYEFRVYPDCRVEFVGRNQSITSADAWEPLPPSIYPNPFRNSFEVDLGDERTAAYVVYNAVGQLVQQGTLSGQETITLPTDRSGLYVLKLRGQQLNYTKVLIRQ